MPNAVRRLCVPELHLGEFAIENTFLAMKHCVLDWSASQGAVVYPPRVFLRTSAWALPRTGKRRRSVPGKARSRVYPSQLCGRLEDAEPFHSSDFDAPSEFTQAQSGAETSYLKKLTLQDFILVKREEVTFDPGFNVITGESGAGKSVLIEALSQVFGKTSLGDCVRDSCDCAVLEATFHLSPSGVRRIRAVFRQMDVPNRALSHLHASEEGELILRREILHTGSGLRSQCFVNGVATSVRVLRAVANSFFDINGQNSVTQLGNKERQMQLIDSITGQSVLKNKIADIYRRMSELKSMLSVSSEFEDAEIREEAQKLCDTVDDANISPGEERSLRYTLKVLETHAHSVESAVAIGNSLDGRSEGILHLLQDISSRIKTIVRLEQRNAEFSDNEDENEDETECKEGINCALRSLDGALEHIDNAEEEILRAADDVLNFASFMKFDQVEQSELRQRLKYVEKLLKDFECRSSEELLDLASETEARLKQYHDSCDKRTNWESELASLEEQYIQKSVDLSLSRRETAGKLRKAIEDCLYDLAMQQSRFDVRVNWEQTKQITGLYVTSEIAQKAGERGDERYQSTVNGFDSVEFLLAAGPAEPLRALSGVASGGECARIMLAFKAAPTLISDISASNENESSGTVLVLDELDTGVGVRLGRTVGLLLRNICTNARVAKNQVICVSHLPQVAAYASRHIKACKSVDADGKVEIQFQPLANKNERRAEIVAMMGGQSEDFAYDLLNEMEE